MSAAALLEVGRAVIVIVVVGTVAFFVGGTWDEFAGTLCDYLSYVCGGGEDMVVVDSVCRADRPRCEAVILDV